jgi:hypothetical protein
VKEDEYTQMEIERHLQVITYWIVNFVHRTFHRTFGKSSLFAIVEIKIGTGSEPVWNQFGTITVYLPDEKSLILKCIGTSLELVRNRF